MGVTAYLSSMWSFFMTHAGCTEFIFHACLGLQGFNSVIGMHNTGSLYALNQVVNSRDFFFANCSFYNSCRPSPVASWKNHEKAEFKRSMASIITFNSKLTS